jgi:hypothetical protein
MCRVLGVDASITMLLDRLAAPETEPVIRLFPGALVERQSARLPATAQNGHAGAWSQT